jgi:F0F1-type ATP synthase epsilon subunit
MSRVMPLRREAEQMTGSLEVEIRKIREQANILAEEARVLEENSDERARAARERARKASERLQRLLQEKPTPGP